MKIGTRWKICWNEYSSDTYLFGSKIAFGGKEDVAFSNELMPPGTIIKRWYSKTFYQAQRIEPALPLIDGESTYRLIVDIDTEKMEECLIKLVFFDKYGQEAGHLIVRDKEMDFKCPLKTYSYEMQLINGGMKRFRFHSIVLCELATDGLDEA